MNTKKVPYILGTILAAFVGVTLILISGSDTVQAGIYRASDEVTYKEYWIPHSEFTAGCGDHATGGGSYYFEPWPCEKALIFNIPDDFSNALKAEIYVDLWRNNEAQYARFSINNGPTHIPDAANHYSRTPYVAEIPLNELQQGSNIISFWTGGGGYHVHDVAFRIYYDGSNPLVGSDVTPPDGSLDSIEADNGIFAASTGGTLAIDSDQLVLTATVTGDAKFVEFHAYYDGYDEDNDTVFRDWHNLGRNNWYPGGTNEQATGGTINHIGTVAVTTPGNYSITWQLPHIINQSGVRFKIRVVDDAGNVREAAGGVSAPFALVRSKPMAAFYNPDFQGASVHGGGADLDEVAVNVELPNDINLYDTAYLIGAYWKNPIISINNHSNLDAFPDAIPNGKWSLSILEIPISYLQPGQNEILYQYRFSFGELIERPGPMIVLKRNGNTLPDNTDPIITALDPISGAINVDVDQSIVAKVSDIGSGVDIANISMTVDGNSVTPQITGFSNEYTLTYKQGTPLPYSTVILVNVIACDLAATPNCTVASYSFTTEEPDTTPPQITDIQVSARHNNATISWTTNELTTGRVDFGLTSGYGSSQQDNTLALTHSVELTGLLSETIYHYQVVAVDGQGNSTDTADFTFTTQSLSEVISDDFNYCNELDPMWEFMNPIGDSSYAIVDKQLEIYVPGGTNHDIYPSGNPADPLIRAPHIMQVATNPDDLQVKFASGVNQEFQLQGILVEEDADTFLRVNFQWQGGAVRVLVISFANGVPTTLVNQSVTGADGNGPLYLSLIHSSNDWRVWHSIDNVNWFFNDFSPAVPLAISKVGVFAGNSSITAGNEPPHTAVVDYFFNVNNAIDPEDGKAIHLPINVIGNGIVNKSGECDNPVTLTPAPDLGWSFGGWSGAHSGTEDPLIDFSFTFTDVLTATFTRDIYMMSVDVVSIDHEGNTVSGGAGGSVSVDQEFPYYYNDIVTLTANPAPGWAFTGWDGAGLSGNSLSETITMHQSESVTATFTQEKYSITTDVFPVDKGNVIVELPTEGRTYLIYGDEVVLRAELTDVDWHFVSWGGTLSGSQNPKTFIVVGDVSVMATFSDTYTIFLPIVVSLP